MYAIPPMNKIYLALDDGSFYEGLSFGFSGESAGELVFNTSMTGYQEILTDPSYCGQIVVMTYPMIGNYGVHEDDTESEKVQVAGFIVKEYSPQFSNWRATFSLGDYLKNAKIPAGEGFPTRNLVQNIRDKGNPWAILSTLEANKSVLIERAKTVSTIVGKDLVKHVTCQKPYFFSSVGKKRFKIAAIDYGIKQNILRELGKRGCEIEVLPATTSAREIMQKNYDGLLLSNGPGDPSAVSYAIENLKKLVGQIPIFAICLGHQLLAEAMGAKTFKLKFGHRGANHPVKDLLSQKVLITSQNHGFAVDSDDFPNDLEITQISLNDNTVEAFRHREFPVLSVQYHPEASPGPHDSMFLFDQFMDLLCQRVAK